ncbi:MAG: replicative DNA helicase [Pseudomonadota bacterium]
MAVKPRGGRAAPQATPKVFDRVPPQSIEAEQSVLGACLIGPEAMAQVADVIRPQDFYRTDHGLIFAAMLDLFDRHIPVDLVSVSDTLHQRGEMEQAGGSAYLARLCDAVPTMAGLVYHARIIRDKALLRELICTAAQVSAQAYEASEPVENVLDAAESGIFAIAERTIHGAFVTLKKVVEEGIATVQSRYENKGAVTGISTGYRGLDNLTSGLQRSDLIIIAGRPSMGKTAFALNLARNAALELDAPVAFFSLEMSSEQLGLRLLASQSKVESDKLRSGFLSPHEWGRLTDAADALSKAQIYIDDTAALSVMEMRAKSRRLKSEKKCDLIVVDYLQLMRGSGRTDSREQEISEISRSLKGLAKELKVPVVALSQLNRKVEERPNKRPQLADLRESGAIEQDADVIMFVYRDKVYNPESPAQNTAEVIIGKQRNGPLGKVELTFLDRFTSFEEMVKPTGGEPPPF